MTRTSCFAAFSFVVSKYISAADILPLYVAIATQSYSMSARWASSTTCRMMRWWMGTSTRVLPAAQGLAHLTWGVSTFMVGW